MELLYHGSINLKSGFLSYYKSQFCMEGIKYMYMTFWNIGNI